jgi:L-ascorbate metabolism protein UlaG (beta-lactamase superfamily)
MVYLSNSALETILPDYPGNALLNGKFLNYRKSSAPKLKDILRWQFSFNPERYNNKHSTYQPNLIEDQRIFDKSIDKIVWLGHASFLLTLNGKHILVDPVFKHIPLVKRRVKIPFEINAYRQIDYVLITHAHFDHLDRRTLIKLAKLNPQMQIYCGLQTAATLQKWKISNPIVEAGWFQKFPESADGIEFYFLPAQHWSNRSLKDRNCRLWGSFIVRCAQKTLYLMGDSAYAEHFSAISQLFPAIDYALLGVGAYTPQYIMQTSHLNPAEAFQAFNDLAAKQLIPMHYGTFILADEPIAEPILKTRQLFAETPEHLCELSIGELLRI